MVCFKFLHPKFSNNTNKHKLKSNLQKLEFSKHLVQIAWGLTTHQHIALSILSLLFNYGDKIFVLEK